MLIRCTAKLLKEIGLTNSSLIDNVPDESTLGEWYANLFFAQRKKCIIFTNARTLFTFISFDVNRAEIRNNLGKLFCTGLGKALLDEDFDGALIQRLVNEYSRLQFARTKDRSILGVMVDHAKNIKWMLMRYGGLAEADYSRIIKQLNRTPLLTKEFPYSIEELRKVLGIRLFTSSHTSSNSPEPH